MTSDGFFAFLAPVAFFRSAAPETLARAHSSGQKEQTLALLGWEKTKQQLILLNLFHNIQ